MRRAWRCGMPVSTEKLKSPMDVRNSSRRAVCQYTTRNARSHLPCYRAYSLVLAQGMDRAAARERVGDKIDEILAAWRS